jgi:signal transduction histidine kinase
MCEKINESTQRLSGIITTFRNYLMETKEVRDIVLQDVVKQSLEIINITLTDNAIKLIQNIEENSPIVIRMVSGELSEVIINIISNAKDILLEKNTEKPWVVVELKKLQEKVIITIEDNGGGVPESIIVKVFEQNFTTKDKSHGTGLGLYMSYRIITESLNGSIYVQNTLNGAKFFLEIPLK